MAERLFYVRGEIDAGSAPALHATLDDAVAFNDADLLIDFTEVSFIDSSGLVVLGTVKSNLRGMGRKLRITNATSATEWILRIAGLMERHPVTEAPEEGHAATG